MSVFKVDVTGFEEVERMLLNESAIAKAAVPKMLEAGAKVLIESQQKAARRDIRKNTGFVESIGIYKTEFGGTNPYIIVLPTGNANHGNASAGGGGRKRERTKGKKGPVRNVEIGFLLEYGTSSMRATGWLTTANEESETKVHEAMMEVWRSYNGGS